MSKPSDLEGLRKVEAEGHELALGNSNWNRAGGSRLRDVDLINGCPWPTSVPSRSNLRIPGALGKNLKLSEHRAYVDGLAL